jgi:hypothetical protein
MNLELAKLERRIAPGLTVLGITLHACQSSGGSGSSGHSNDGSSASGSKSSKSKSRDSCSS